VLAEAEAEVPAALRLETAEEGDAESEELVEADGGAISWTSSSSSCLPSAAEGSWTRLRFWRLPEDVGEALEGASMGDAMDDDCAPLNAPPRPTSRAGCAEEADGVASSFIASASEAWALRTLLKSSRFSIERGQKTQQKMADKARVRESEENERERRRYSTTPEDTRDK